MDGNAVANLRRALRRDRVASDLIRGSIMDDQTAIAETIYKT